MRPGKHKKRALYVTKDEKFSFVATSQDLIPELTIRMQEALKNLPPQSRIVFGAQFTTFEKIDEEYETDTDKNGRKRTWMNVEGIDCFTYNDETTGLVFAGSVHVTTPKTRDQALQIVAQLVHEKPHLPGFETD